MDRFAIVDIETTGGYAANNGITELAIVLMEGNKILERYVTLINPQVPIPHYIQVLTGITPAMVAGAPTFDTIAAKVFSLLEDAIFVAHHVNFDYSFIRHHLLRVGYALDSKKICTVRLGRKVLPGLSSYSLGKLCQQLDIPIENRHRAGGDADATVLLFQKILANDKEGFLSQMLRGRNREQYLPPNLPAENLTALPYTCGVYYFHDQWGKVIYVGKAKNIRSRVCSHFSNNSPSLRKQQFLRNIYSVTWQDCGTELIAFLLECVEIRRLWPRFNRSLKIFEPAYGLYRYEDQQGYHRLAIEKRKPCLTAYHTFNNLSQGRELLRTLVRDHALCATLCFLNSSPTCLCDPGRPCRGACRGEEDSASYNARLKLALTSLTDWLPTFVIRDQGRDISEESCVLVERGKFSGMGYLKKQEPPENLENLRERLTPYPENDYMRSLIYSFVQKWPEKKKTLSDFQSAFWSGQRAVRSD